MDDFERITEAITFIHSNFRRQPGLEQVAGHIHLSPYHVQRLFTRWAGISPKKFLEYVSVSHLRTALRSRDSAPLSELSFDAGLSGTGRLHDLFVTIEGMTPGEYRNGGEHLAITCSIGESPFGRYLVASTAKGICHLAFIDDERAAVSELRRTWPGARIEHARETDGHRRVKEVLIGATRDTRPLCLHVQGTGFQLKVWEALLRIPEGALETYSGLARMIGEESACRAVAGAVSRNPVAYLIPCHRVIKKVGGIGEYRWGGVRKLMMIGWEGARMDRPARAASTVLRPVRSQ